MTQIKKNDRMAEFVAKLAEGSQSALDPCYTGFFKCFNIGEYYEAHDVLEHLWLQCTDAYRLYYQGLIQIAGAFVHLQKQYLRPEHHKDGKRMHPAVRLFLLGSSNIAPFGPQCMHLDVAALLELCARLSAEIVASDYSKNPWHPDRLPQLHLSEPA